ncbi:MAG: adenylyltransferase/cytidyltransferase family protein [Puniceicoccales bacterium]|jgi:rfaE bifunctional protein nucleotidyltransferase chain/domain|nr:adenylyltransferase/cytidyltransferase family protein [Puniceicoccales bacterium]
MNLIPSKLFNFSNACGIREKLREENQKVVLTNGCFDVLHPGHIFSLENAKKLGDSLWVALNSDMSVKALKGDKRPIFTEKMRAYILSALSVVDGIFIFNGSRLTDEILHFHPDIYAKSGDYTIDTLDLSERKALQTIGAEIHLLPFIKGLSTTSIIGKFLYSYLP